MKHGNEKLEISMWVSKRNYKELENILYENRLKTFNEALTWSLNKLGRFKDNGR